jgi:hypothetical protein
MFSISTLSFPLSSTRGRTRFLYVLLLVIPTAVVNAEGRTGSLLPEPVQRCFAAVDLLSVYSVSKGVHPTWVKGNFHGEGNNDFAVLLVENRTQKRIVAICRAGSRAPDLIGSGVRLPESERFLQGFKHWRVALAQERSSKTDALEFWSEDWCGSGHIWISYSGTGQYEYELEDEDIDCESGVQ